MSSQTKIKVNLVSITESKAPVSQFVNAEVNSGKFTKFYRVLLYVQLRSEQVSISRFTFNPINKITIPFK